MNISASVSTRYVDLEVWKLKFWYENKYPRGKWPIQVNELSNLNLPFGVGLNFDTHAYQRWCRSSTLYKNETFWSHISHMPSLLHRFFCVVKVVAVFCCRPLPRRFGCGKDLSWSDKELGLNFDTHINTESIVIQKWDLLKPYLPMCFPSSIFLCCLSI